MIITIGMASLGLASLHAAAKKRPPDDAVMFITPIIESPTIQVTRDGAVEDLLADGSLVVLTRSDMDVINRYLNVFKQDPDVDQIRILHTAGIGRVKLFGLDDYGEWAREFRTGTVGDFPNALELNETASDILRSTPRAVTSVLLDGPHKTVREIMLESVALPVYTITISRDWVFFVVSTARLDEQGNFTTKWTCELNGISTGLLARIWYEVDQGRFPTFKA